MKIGGIITHFNSSATIERAILGAIDQQPSFDEIIIVDDHSNIIEFQKVQGVCEKYKSVRLIRNKANKGYAFSLNKGVAELDCDYIFILDDDDECLSWRTRKQVELLNQGAEFVYASRLVNCNGVITLNKTVDFEFLHPIEKGIPELLFTGRYKNQNMLGEFGSCTLAFRRDTFIEMTGFDTRFRRKAEWDFVIRCALAKKRITSVQMPCIVQHKTVGNKTEKGIVISMEMDKLLLEKHMDILKSRRIYYLAKAYLNANRYKYYNIKTSYFTHLIMMRLLRLSPFCR